MSKTGPPWEHLGTFLAVLRDGSLSGAARRLGLAQPTVRRRLDELEGALESVLFTRSPHGLTPTDAARAMAQHVEAMAASAQAAARAASSPADAPRGVVRVAASEIVGTLVLPGLLADLVATHPALCVEVVPSNRVEDLLRREADVAVRMTTPRQSSLVGRRIGAVKVGLFASDSYLARRGVPPDASALASHALVGADRERGLREALAEAGVDVPARAVAFRSDSEVAQLFAVRAGLGVGACQVPLAARFPELRRVLPGLGVSLPVWVVTHPELRETLRVRVVIDRLAEGLWSYLRGQAIEVTNANQAANQAATAARDGPTAPGPSTGGPRRKGQDRSHPRRSSDRRSAKA